MFAAKLLTHMLAASLGTQVGERGISHFHAMFISSSVILELSIEVKFNLTLVEISLLSFVVEKDEEGDP